MIRQLRELLVYSPSCLYQIFFNHRANPNYPMTSKKDLRYEIELLKLQLKEYDHSPPSSCDVCGFSFTREDKVKVMIETGEWIHSDHIEDQDETKDLQS